MLVKLIHDEQGEKIAKWVTLDTLAVYLRPLLVQPAPADVASLDARAQRAELQLADAQQANAMLTAQLETQRSLTAQYAGWYNEAVRQRDAYRAQADAARQAATEAAQRAEQAEAQLASYHSPRPAYQD